MSNDRSRYAAAAIEFRIAEAAAEMLKRTKPTKASMNIAPVTDFFPTSRQGGLHHIRQQDIEAVLGFGPTVEAYDKVEAEWNFTVDGIRCAIWDYKRSADLGFWSFFGPRKIFVHLFGADHVS